MTKQHPSQILKIIINLTMNVSLMDNTLQKWEKLLSTLDLPKTPREGHVGVALAAPERPAVCGGIITWVVLR